MLSMSVLIKGGRIVTAADDYVGDIFIEGERISRIGRSLGDDADVVIDATGKLVLPGRDRPAHASRHALRRHGHDRRRHVGPDRGGVRRHDLPYRLLHPGAGPVVRRRARRLAREARWQGDHRQRLPHRRHRPARGRLARGARDACPTRASPRTSSSWPTRARSWSTTRRSSRRCRWPPETGALVMVHAENGDAIDVLVKEALAAGNTAPVYHALTRPPGARGRGDEPRHPARAHRGRAAVRRPRLVQGVGRPDREGTPRRLGRLGRDVHAVLLHRPDVPRAARLRGRQVRLHAAAARQGEPGGALGRGAHRCPLGDLDRPLRLPLGRAEDDGQGRLLEDPERRPGPREPAAHDPRVRRAHRAGSPSTAWSSCSRRTPAKLFGLYPRKGTIAPGSDADIVVFDPNRKKTITAATQHSKSDYNLYEGTEVTGDIDTVLVRGTVVVDGGELKVEPGFGQFVARARFGETLA